MAKPMKFSLECVDGFGRLSIWDNGIGLSLDDPNHRGIGLHTMDYRAGAIGGSLTIARRPEGGTVVVCAFDLSQTHDLRDGPVDALG